MKRKLLSLALLFLLMAALSACGSRQTLLMGTGGTTGIYYKYGSELAGALNKNVKDIKVTVKSSGGSKANIIGVSDGSYSVGLARNDMIYCAGYGSHLFEDGPVEGFSAVGSLYADNVYIVGVGEIREISDLAGNHVSVGTLGSGTEFCARQIVETGSMTFNDLYIFNYDLGQSIEALKSGEIDAFFCLAGVWSEEISSLAESERVNFLTFEEEQISALMAQYPFYSRSTIAAGTYEGLEEEVDAVAIRTSVICSSSLKDEVVYSLAKGLYENQGEVEHEYARLVDAGSATEGLVTPIHPGAEKYFKEIGLLS